MNITTIIKEEIAKLIDEYFDYDNLPSEYEVKHKIFTDFLYNNNPEFTKNIPWKLIPFARLKKIWEDFIRTGVVRDTRGLEMIEEIVTNNIMKIYAITDLAGHTQWGDKESFEEHIGNWVDDQMNCILKHKGKELQLDSDGSTDSTYNASGCEGGLHPFVSSFFDKNYKDGMDLNEFRNQLYEEMVDRFFYYYVVDPQSGHNYISDYGLNPLMVLMGELYRADKPEDEVVIIDKMLNVVHQRSDLASWFVEGGSNALNSLSGYSVPENEKDPFSDYVSSISGKYRLSDYR